MITSEVNQKPLTNIHPLIKNRRSIRAFSDKSISEETLEQLLEAARWGASSMNEQPWRFVVALKEDIIAFDNMTSCLLPGNASWAKNSAALLLVCSKLFFTQNNLPNRHAMHDTGFAIANLSVEATHLDLYLHQMGGFDQNKARQLFNVPQDYETVSIIAIGYKGDVNILPENFKERETATRHRKELNEIAFRGKFNSPLNK